MINNVTKNFLLFNNYANWKPVFKKTGNLLHRYGKDFFVNIPVDDGRKLCFYIICLRDKSITIVFTFNHPGHRTPSTSSETFVQFASCFQSNATTNCYILSINSTSILLTPECWKAWK